MVTYRNDLAYQFCPGCSHGLVLDALDRALQRMGERDAVDWKPERIVIVTDIGCAGLSDQYFVTSGFHGLHGRSLTYATGIKLAHPELHVVTILGDGGCGIGGTHLLSAARRNIGVTTLVFNNLNFGMTGGEHSVTTPFEQRTSTTPLGNPEMPLDIAATVAANGATFVWRGTAMAPDLDQQIEAALGHEGFALLDIWELCVAYYASLNKVSPAGLRDEMARLGFEEGVIKTRPRPVGTLPSQPKASVDSGALPYPVQPIDVRFEPNRVEPVSLLIAGGAGGHVRTAGRMVCTAATMSGLWASQRDDYPVTVRAGHSTSELQIASRPIETTPCEDVDVLFVLHAEGLKKVAGRVAAMTARRDSKERWIFVTPELAQDLDRMAGTKGKGTARILLLDPSRVKGIARSSQALAAVAAGLAYTRVLTPEALIEAAAALSPTYAETNRDAVAKALASLQTLVVPRPS